MLYCFNPFLEQRQVVLQSQLLILDDANEFDELVVLFFLFRNVFLSGYPLPYILKSICSSLSVSNERIKFILSERMVDSVPSSI